MANGAATSNHLFKKNICELLNIPALKATPLFVHAPASSGTSFVKCDSSVIFDTIFLASVNVNSVCVVQLIASLWLALIIC